MSDKPMAYIRDDGTVVFRASAVGKCSRALWASLSEISPQAPSTHLEQIFAEGHLHEEAMRQQLNERGDTVTDAQDDVELWIIPGKLVIVGHVDGFVDMMGRRVWENKALARSSFDKWVKHRFDQFEDYAWQISIYMLATGCKAFYTVKRRDDGLIDEFLIDEPPIPLEEIRRKTLAVYTAFLRGRMPVCDPERWGCFYWFLHDEIPADDSIDMPVPLEGPQEKMDELGSLWMVLTETEKEIGERKKKIRAEMDKLRGTATEWSTPNHTFKVQSRVRENVDKSKLILEQGKEFLTPYLKKTEYDMWTIKERNIATGE